MEHSRDQRDQAALIQRRVFVTGRVQGVGFRAATVRAVQKQSPHSSPALQGFVRNLPDGKVEALFAGAEDDVLRLVAWCKKGPLLCKVTKLEVFEEEYDPTLQIFQILQ